MLFSRFTRFLGSYITFFLLNSMIYIMLYSEGGIYYSYLSCYVCAYIVKVVCNALFIMAYNMLYRIFHLFWIFHRFNTLFNMLYSTFSGRPGSSASAASDITVARPGHNSDCAQAPVGFVACSTAGVVTCSRLIVRKVRPRARGAVTVGLLATHAYPASDRWHGQFKF